jgi:hypothetical protein
VNEKFSDKPTGDDFDHSMRKKYYTNISFLKHGFELWLPEDKIKCWKCHLDL